MSSPYHRRGAPGLVSPPDTDRNRSDGRAGALAALGAHLALSAGLFSGAWRSPGDRWIGVAGDPQQTMWFTSWVAHALTHGENPLFSDHLNHPDGVNLMWNTSSPLLAGIGIPVRLALGPIVAYNLWVTLAFALSGWAAFLMFRRWTRHAGAAFAGSLLYGFSPYMTAHGFSQLALVMAVLPPVLLLAADEVCVRQRVPARRMGLVMGLVVAAQVLVSEEIAASAALCTGVGVAVLALLHRDQVGARAGHALKVAAWTAVTAAVVCAGPLGFQFLGPQSVAGHVQPSGYFVTDLANLVLPTEVQALSPAGAGRQFTGSIVESTGYLGVAMLAILVFMAVRHRRDPLVRAALVTLGVIVVLSLGPRLHINGWEAPVPLPWALVEALPVLGAMLPARLSLYAGLLAALLVALFTDRHIVGRRPRGGALLLAAAVLSWLPLLRYPSHPAVVPQWFREGVAEVEPGSVVLVAPFADLYLGSDAMLWQAVADMRFRMPEGYFIGPAPNGLAYNGVYPYALSKLFNAIDVEGDASVTPGRPRPPMPPASEIHEALRDREVRAIVVGPMENRARVIEVVTAVVGCPPRETQGVALWGAITEGRCER